MSDQKMNDYDDNEEQEEKVNVISVICFVYLTRRHRNDSNPEEFSILIMFVAFVRFLSSLKSNHLLFFSILSVYICVLYIYAQSEQYSQLNTTISCYVIIINMCQTL